MNVVRKLEFHAGTKEERLPDFTADFPYLMSYAVLDQYAGRRVPWHWHKAVELFYMESGALEYCTPGGKLLFSSGSGGFINSNILHSTKALAEKEKNIQLLHLFDPSFISGGLGSRIERKYVIPLITAPQIEMIAFYPEQPAQAEILRLIREAFRFQENEVGYEIKIRETLSKIWMMLFETLPFSFDENRKNDKNDARLKTMLIYIHEHFKEKIRISELAAAAYLSERECFRLFHNCLRITPTEYIKNYRLQQAAQMLADGKLSVAEISQACGLGNSSYFGKIFREYADCTPVEYRKRWQDCEK